MEVEERRIDLGHLCYYGGYWNHWKPFNHLVSASCQHLYRKTVNVILSVGVFYVLNMIWKQNKIVFGVSIPYTVHLDARGCTQLWMTLKKNFTLLHKGTSFIGSCE